MQKHTEKAKQAELLGKQVEKKTVSFNFNGRSPCLVHTPCYNGKITQNSIEGMIHITKKYDPHNELSDKPENFKYECKECGETWEYNQ